MATNLDVITQAYRISNLINAIQTLNSSQSTQGLTKLNDMLADWEEDGIELGYYPQTILSATIPIADQYLRGVKHNLAAEIDGALLRPREEKIARDTYARLAKGTLEVFENSFDHMPMGRGRFNINNG